MFFMGFDEGGRIVIFISIFLDVEDIGRRRTPTNGERTANRPAGRSSAM
jgi:hypothetical protein